MSEQEAVETLKTNYPDACFEQLREAIDTAIVALELMMLPSAQPERKTCEGCKHKGMWENELEYGYDCPCLICKRRVSDNYER